MNNLLNIFALNIYTDINECMEAAFNSEYLCDKNTHCVNKEGSFECPCVPGYEFVNDTCQRK